MQSFPKVFIIVLNYNGKKWINRCLNSIYKIDYPNLEVIFVDNNSQDESLELAKKFFPKTIFIKNEENLGYAAGNNIGIRFALERGADYVLLLNNDTEVESDFLQKLIEVAETNRKIGLVSPLILEGNSGGIWFSGGRIFWEKMRSVHEKDEKKEEFYDTEFLTGCSLLIKAAVFKETGLLDEDFFLYWEDVDFSFRAKKAGFRRVVVSSSRIWHFEDSEKNKKTKIYWLVISGLIFFKKNTPWSKKLWVAAYLFLRKAKNLWDVKYKRNEINQSVQKAYQDFKNFKSIS